MSKIKTYVICGVIFFLSLGKTFAQQELSLADAIKLGLERNYDIRIEGKNIKAAANNNAWGEAGLFPQITAQFQGSHNTFDNREAINPFSIIGKTVTVQGVPSVNLNWNLLNIRGLVITKHRLEELEAESEGNAEIIIANNVQSIIMGYYVAVLEKRRLAVFEQQLNLSSDKYNLLQVRKEIGNAGTSDLLLEEVNYLTDSTNYINQTLVHRNALSNLNFLIGEPDVLTEYLLVDDLKFDDVNVTYDQLVVQLEKENVDLRKQCLTQSVLGYDLALRKADQYPQLSIGANYNFTRNRQDVSDWPLARREIRDQQGNVTDVLDVGNNENVTYGANFTISFTLFDGDRINRAIQRSIIQQDIGSIRVEKLKSSLKRDLAQAVDQYNIRKSLYAISERRFQSSKLNLDISNDKFDNGTINSFDFRTVQTNNLSAAIDRLQALYNLIDSQVTLMRLTGGIIETYME